MSDANSEINNNGCYLVGKMRKVSQISLSSISDYQSDSSDEGSKNEGKPSMQEVSPKNEDKRTIFKQKGRSMSDGEARKYKETDSNSEIFPSLPNSVLEKLGLKGDGPREHISQEEQEQKFTGLALAFTTDAQTVKVRCERHRRSRYQTESNLNAEIEKLREKLTLMEPLCTDYEKAEIFSTILSQIDTIINAISLVSMAAERFGAVQHEERLTESVGLMVSHVQLLKQQRDDARRQLQFTQKVLKSSPESQAGSPTGGISTSSPLTPNRKIISQRRASIASITQQTNDARTNLDLRKVTRRTSDLSLRTNTLNRIVRPNRLELSGDLVKIKEGYAEMELLHESETISDVDNEESVIESFSTVSSPEEDSQKEIDFSKLPLREKILHKCGTIKTALEEKYQSWSENGSLHDVYYFCAFLCFSLSFIMLVNILIEYEYAKWGFMPWTKGGNKNINMIKK